MFSTMRSAKVRSFAQDLFFEIRRELVIRHVGRVSEGAKRQWFVTELRLTQPPLQQDGARNGRGKKVQRKREEL